jgi:hypothetical protein
MALPTDKIFLRSPYYVNLTRANLDRIALDLYVYTGELTTDKPADPNYTLESTAYPSDGGRFAQIDISEMARDFVELTYDGNNESNAVWVEYDLYYADIGDSALTLHSSNELTGLPGYGYFEDGYNPNVTDYLLLSSDTILIPSGGSVDIPVLQDKLTDWSLAKVSVQTYASGALTPTENTANVVFYADTGLSSQPDPDRAIFAFTDVPDKTIYLRYYEECLNDEIQCSFGNRFGAVQDIWFRGRTSQVLQTTEASFKRNILEGTTYDTKKHQNTILNKNSEIEMIVNTGFLPQNMNATMQELFESEKVWITVPYNYFDKNQNKTAQVDKVIPVNINTSTIQFKENKYDKLINYTFRCKFAADRINSVR